MYNSAVFGGVVTSDCNHEILPQSISCVSLFPDFNVHKRRQTLHWDSLLFTTESSLLAKLLWRGRKEKLTRGMSDSTTSEVAVSFLCLTPQIKRRGFRSAHQHSNCRFGVDPGCSPTSLCCWGLWPLLLQVRPVCWTLNVISPAAVYLLTLLFALPVFLQLL